MISVIKNKKYVAGTNIFGIIIGKFYYKKKLCLIILFKIDKASKIGVNCAILSLGLQFV